MNSEYVRVEKKDIKTKMEIKILKKRSMAKFMPSQ
jgi:hypothetical protein